MSAFTQGGAVVPFLAADTGTWTWAVSDPLIWDVRTSSQGFSIIVPQGFHTDLGTIPWWARWAINPADPQCAKAWVLHDFILSEYGPVRQMFAASQLYEALRALGVTLIKRKMQIAFVIAAIDDW